MFNALPLDSQEQEEHIQQVQSQDEIIRITIDLGNNLPAESIIVLRGEENKCDEIARRFCEKHGFDEKIEAALTQQIQRNIDQVMDQATQSVEEDGDGTNTERDHLQDQITNQNRYDDDVVEENLNQSGSHDRPFGGRNDTESTRRIASREASTFKQRQGLDNFGAGIRREGGQIIENLNQTSSSQRQNEEGAVEQMYSSAVPHHDNLQHDLIRMRNNQRKLQQNFAQQIRGELGTSNNDSAAVRPVSEHRQTMQEQLPELPLSEILSYEGANGQQYPNHFPEPESGIGINEEHMYYDGQGPHELDDQDHNGLKKLRYSGYQGASQFQNVMPQRDSVNFQLLHPECREKPQINQVSRLLAQGKRSNEPIHERLFKQDILAKRIAQEIQNEPNVERSRSGDQQKTANSKRVRGGSALGMTRPVATRNHFKGNDPSQAVMNNSMNRSNYKSAQRLANYTNDDSIAQIQNPGARLYQRGIQMNHEKERFIEQARKEKEDKELMNHCTFKPKLVTQDYYQINDFNSSSKYNSETMLDEFNEDSARNPQVPSVTVEKLIIKDGESIHVKKQRSPTQEMPLTDSNVNDCSLVYTHDGNQTQEIQKNQTYSNHLTSQASKSQILGYQSTSERLMKFGQNIQSKRQLQREAQLAQEDSQYDYQPRINHRSRSIASQKSQGTKSKQNLNVQKSENKSGQEGLRSSVGEGKMHQFMTQSHYDDRGNKSQIIYNNQDASFLDQSNYAHSNMNNQTQMPGGDDDDEVEEIPEDISDSGDEGHVSKVMDISIEMKTKTNPKSKQSTSQSRTGNFKPPDNDKFLALYDDAKHRNLRQEHIYAKCFDKECTFKPRLVTKQSKVSQMTVKEVQKQVYDKTQQIEQKPAVGGVPSKAVTNCRLAYLSNREVVAPSIVNVVAVTNAQPNYSRQQARTLKSVKSEEGQVFDRLSKQALIYQNLKKEKKELQDSCMINPDSGKEMFKPSINTSKLMKDKPANQGQIISNMYNRHKLILEKKKKALNDAEEKCNVMRRRGSKANKFSEQIVAQSRKSKINQIFDQMDSDGDGLISSIRMDSSFMDAQLIEIFRPLFAELDQLQEPLDRDEFIDATTRLYNCLPQNDKNLILRFGKKKVDNDYQLANCTFKPVTNSYKLSLIRRPLSQARPKSATGVSGRAPVLSSNLGIGGSIMDKILRQKDSNQILNYDLNGVSSPLKSKIPGTSAAVCPPQSVKTVISAPKVENYISVNHFDASSRPATSSMRKTSSTRAESFDKKANRKKKESMGDQNIKIDVLMESNPIQKEDIYMLDQNISQMEKEINESALAQRKLSIGCELIVEAKKVSVDDISPLIKSSYLINEAIPDTENVDTATEKQTIIVTSQNSSEIMNNVLSNFMDKKVENKPLEKVERKAMPEFSPQKLDQYLEQIQKPARFARVDSINNENIPPHQNSTIQTQTQYDSINVKSNNSQNRSSSTKKIQQIESPQKKGPSPTKPTTFSQHNLSQSPAKVLQDKIQGVIVTIEQETPVGRSSQQIRELGNSVAKGMQSTKQRKTKADRKNSANKTAPLAVAGTVSNTQVMSYPDHFVSIMTQATQLVENHDQGIMEQDEEMTAFDNGPHQNTVSRRPMDIPRLKF